MTDRHKRYLLYGSIAAIAVACLEIVMIYSGLILHELGKI